MKKSGKSISTEILNLQVWLASSLSLVLFIAITGCAPMSSQSTTESRRVMNLDETKQVLVGDWKSIAPEIRPSASKNPDGTLKPFYLKRDFKYVAEDRFELGIVNFVDANGTIPLTRIVIKGHMFWPGPHPIAAGAQKVDFIADEDYEVTPLIQGFADLLNKVAGAGFQKWEVNSTQSVFGKTFIPFGLTAGKNFMEYDLVYLNNGMLFWGARNVDGRGFDTELNRPTNLQIPLVRK